MPRRARSEMTVDELNYYIQGLFTSDLMLKALVVSGEIAEFKRHTSGHCYFTLLGAETRVSCALFKRDAELLPQWPRDGDSVLIEGSVSSYPPRGVYQLYARRILPVGDGAAGRARQELRNRLEAEGLFHPALKRPLPPYPARAAVITSATGAALRDVCVSPPGAIPSARSSLSPRWYRGSMPRTPSSAPLSRPESSTTWTAFCWSAGAAVGRT